MTDYKLGERPYENILEKYNVTNPLALVLYDDIYKKGHSDGYVKAIDDFVNLVNECSGYTQNCVEHNLCLTIYTIHQIAEQLKTSDNDKCDNHNRK